jgi:hypothetical protein
MDMMRGIMAKKATKASGEKEKTASKASAPAKKKASKGASASAGATPGIDTNLAANAAAAFVGNRLAANRGGGATKPESAGFKQMKESLNKPHVQGLNNVLDSSSQVKRSNVPDVHGGKQVAQRQTYNADVTRSGVPRRNAG